MSHPQGTPTSIGRFLYNTIRNTVFGSAPMSEDEQPATSRINMHEPGQFEPFLADVFEMKNDLCKGLKLPMELVDTIADYAQYWPHTTTRRTNGEIAVRTGRGREEEQMILRSYPLGFLPGGNHPTECSMADDSSFPIAKPYPWSTTKLVEGDATAQVQAKWLEQSQMKSIKGDCRKIVFTIRSHDQGWGGGPQNRGTYRASYTWFDVGKEELVAYKEGQEPFVLPKDQIHTLTDLDESTNKGITCAFHTILPETESSQTSSDDVDIEYTFRHSLEPTSSCLQRNVTAERNMQEHKIVWSCDDDIHPESTGAQALDNIGRGPATGTGEFVRNLKVGDVVTVWAKARFAAWQNTIEDVKIDVYWAV